MKPDAIVQRARALVGTRFRPQGRDPETGLDCIGLILAVYGIAPASVRRDYRLRGDHRGELLREIEARFTAQKQRRPGDLMLCTVAADQLHLAIDCGPSFIHADAGLGLVAETPGEPPWPILRTYRRRVRAARKI